MLQRLTTRVAVVAFIIAFLITSTVAADKSCFERLEAENPVGDSLTVVTVDSQLISGHHAILNVRSSVLYMKLVSGKQQAEDLVIPFNDISRIIYRKASGYRHGITTLGLGVGITAGVIIYLGVTSEPRDWDDIGVGFFSGLLGGVIGTVAGSKIGEGMTSQVTLECP